MVGDRFITNYLNLLAFKASTSYCFIPQSALGYDAVNNSQYLKDDTLYFRMSVEPAE